MNADRATGTATTELIDVPEWSYVGHAPGLTDNLLLHGDNLAVMTALATTHANSVQCVYIDPPYNTGLTFEHYADAAQHTKWLAFMRERLTVLRTLLRDDGVIVVQIDDRECAYLQVLMDEVFGRRQRINVVCVKMSELSGLKMAHAGQRLPKLKEYLLVYGKTDASTLRATRAPKSPDAMQRYLRYYSGYIANFDEPVESWRVVPIKEHLDSIGAPASAEAITRFKLAHADRVVYRTNNKSLAQADAATPIARIVSPTGIEYVVWEGKQMLFLVDHLDEPLGDLWTDLSTINLNKEGGVAFPNGKKPESLVARILDLATRPGDLVLDAFLGSGTTAAVAHKMGRRWIGIEHGPQAITHCVPRLRRVIDGEDRAGITADMGWTGGGGFRFARG